MRYLKMGLFFIWMGIFLSGNFAVSGNAAVSMRGRLERIWGSGQPPQGGEITRSWLARPGQERIELFFDDDQAEAVPQGWIGKQIEVSGKPVHLANGKQALRVESILLIELETTSISSTYTGNTPWVTVLCKYKDIPDEPKPASYFMDMYGSDAPRLDSYWREVSYDQVNLTQSTATPSWNVLPQNKDYYIYDMNGDGEADVDFDRLNADCLALADPTIDYRNYKGIQIMVNADLTQASWGGNQYFNLDGEARQWMVTWLPDWGYQDLSIAEHEMGHGYGMQHSTAPNGRLYENQWDVMSDPMTNCANSKDPVFSCLGQHPNAFNKDLVGWLAADRKITVNTGQMQTIIIERLAQPAAGGILLVIIPIDGSSGRFYTVEVRKKTGYDVKLPGEGVIIHKADRYKQVMAEFVDIDNNNNTGDAAAVWTPGESWEDTANGIWVSVRSMAGEGYEVIVSNDSGNSIPPFPPPVRDQFIFVPFTQTSSDH